MRSSRALTALTLLAAACGPGASGVLASGVGNGPSTPASPALRFKVEVRGAPPGAARRGQRTIPAPPAIGRDLTIYAGSDSGLLALRPDGSRKWLSSLSQVQAREGVWPIATEDGHLFAMTGFGYVHHLDEDGRTVTAVGGMGAKGIFGTPALSHEGLIHVPGSGQLWSFRIDDFKSAWRYGEEKTPWYGAAVGADDTVYAGHGSSLVAVRKDGTVRWSATVGDVASGPPALAPDGTIYIGSRDRSLYALSPEGERRWALVTGGPLTASAAIAADGTIYVGSEDGKLYAVSPSGKALWAFATEGPIHSGPAIAADGTIYVGSADRHLYAVHPKGALKWRFETAGETGSPTLSIDGTVLFESRDGKLYAVRDPGCGGLQRGGGWPKWAGDMGNTSRAPRPGPSGR